MIFSTIVGVSSLLALAAAQPPPWITAGPGPWGRDGPWGAAPSEWAGRGPQYQAQFNNWVSAHNKDWASLTARYGPNWQSWANQASSAFNAWNSDAPWVTANHPNPPAVVTVNNPPSTVTVGGWNGPPFNGGFGPFTNNGPWTTGPWTSWWNGNGGGMGNCPPATWPGWTQGSWATSAPWTTWTACIATGTTTAVYTTNINGIIQTYTSVGVAFAEATNNGLIAPIPGAIIAGGPSLPKPTGVMAMGGAILAGVAAVAAL